MDTFEELEDAVTQNMSKICQIRPIGLLLKKPIPSTSGVSDSDCIEWLDSKALSSVVYVCFGSIVQLKQQQKTYKDSGVLPEGFLGKAGDQGKLVEWSPQEQVLAHPSVACFVTHCGWNSTMEALSSGVPVVAFPQFGDQVTNAKLLVDVFKVGVCMCRSGEVENRIVSRSELEQCLREVTSSSKAV
ncbi:hypothetical protein RJ639_007008 [Escallonia herrerae]|uniref:Uncharacterized protein n=1 Tax=Escallonia herrerae TaxID=1293975 RepID=A0AA88VZJ8_9ASTE|nr:hypothetical protein RJ639_007008 [Escallonia herrerae]